MKQKHSNELQIECKLNGGFKMKLAQLTAFQNYYQLKFMF